MNWFKTFLIILFFILISFLTYVLYLLSPTSLSDEKVRFVIPLETKQEDIIKRLKKENFIRSDSMFSFIIGLMKCRGAVEPGAYMLSRRSFVWASANILLNKPYQKWIILVPGLRVEQVAERLSKKFNWDPPAGEAGENKTKDFLLNAREGYMFPDTYLLNVDYTGKETAQKMISNFNEKFDTQLQNDLLAQNVRNDTAVKIASLIERESGGDSDKALIAGIIWNRLNINMKLQIDAATQYIIGTEKDWWPHVQPSDHKIDSPYNTYIYKGLPPGPIASPSLASIKAVVYPEETDCLFYLHSSDKKIHCSVTYEEHLENIEQYLK